MGKGFSRVIRELANGVLFGGELARSYMRQDLERSSRRHSRNEDDPALFTRRKIGLSDNDRQPRRDVGRVGIGRDIVDPQARDAELGDREMEEVDDPRAVWYAGVAFNKGADGTRVVDP